MGAKDREGWILQVVFCIISNLFDHLLRMGTRLVPIKGEAQ